MNTHASSSISMIMAISAFALTACGEISQDGPKPFTAKEEARPYAGDRFKGDKVLYEKTLAERAQTQNEYLVIGGAKTSDTLAVYGATPARSADGQD